MKSSEIINENYDPSQERATVRLDTDVRRPKLTLKHLNKLRQVRDFRRLEELDRLRNLQLIYGDGAEDDGGFGGGGGFGGSDFGGGDLGGDLGDVGDDGPDLEV